MNPEEYGEIADDLAAVIDTEPAIGGFGPVLYGLVDQGDSGDLDGYLRPSPEDIAQTMRENGLEDPERMTASRRAPTTAARYQVRPGTALR